MKDEDIMDALRAGGAQRMEAYQVIFHHPAIRGAVGAALAGFRARLEKSFPRHDAPRLQPVGQTEIHSYVDHFFVEAFLVFDRKIRRGEITGDSFAQLKAFLASTSRYKCIEWLRRQRPTDAIDEQTDQPDPDLQPDRRLRTRQQVEILDGMLDRLSAKCRKLLSLEAMGYSNPELTRELGFKNTNVLKTSKNRCKKKLYEMIAQDDEYLDLFQEYLP